MNLDYLIKLVNQYFDCDIRKESRKRSIVMSRATYFWLARYTTSFSLAKIGSSVNRDHASVLHSLRNFDDWLKFDPFFKADFETLKIRVLSKIEHKKMSPQTLLYKYNNLVIENDILKNEIKKLKK